MTGTYPALRIGTRGSPLALAQAAELRGRLAAAHPELDAPDAIEIVVIRTTGDAVTDRTLTAIGGKGLFTREIEQALAEGAIDLAVHSMKDVPTILPDGLIIDCFLPREDPRDAFLSLQGGLHDLTPGSVIGTASLRRQAQLLYARPDLKVVPFRGNVGTRLAKLRDSVVDATVLAMAGLNRLGEHAAIATPLSTDIMLPSPAQGAIGIERRQGDERIQALLAPLDHWHTALRITAERALLAVLDGSCRTPIAALAEIDGDRLTLRGLVIKPDGSEQYATSLEGPIADAERIGIEAGAELHRRAGPGFFDLSVPELPAR